MTIKVTYNVTDVYMSQSVSPVYINVSYSDGSSSGGGVWGTITGTLSNQSDLQTALDLKVPYSGATGDVSLGEFGINVGNVIYDTTPTGIPTEQGATYWDADAETVALIMNGTIQKIGEDTFYHVRNTTGSTIAKGTAVRFSGTTGNSGRLLIAPMLADGTYPSQYYMGITSEEIANNQDGKVYHFGKMRNINTSAFADGDVLYVSPSVAGALTATAPVAPNNIIVAAAVVHAANNGTLMIRTTLGSNINSDEGVLITTPTANQGLFYDSGLWVNKSITTALGYTPANAATTLTINGVTYDLSTSRTWTVAAGISGSGASGQVTYWTGASAVSGSNNLFWDNTNGRLGIGTNAPNAEIQITKASAAAGAVGQRVYNTTSSGETYNAIYNDLNEFGSLGIFGSTWGNPNQRRTASFASSALNGFNIAIFNSSATANFSILTGTTLTERLRLYNNTGNLVLQNGGTFSDGGQRLQVIGDTLLRGSGATSATTALTVQNSSSTNLFTVRNDGNVGIGTNAPADTLHLNSGGIRIQNIRASLDNFYTAGVVNGLKIQNTTTNGRTLLGLVPNGTSNLADFWVFNTSDTTTNYSALAWGFESTSNFWGINAISAGTGVTRPIYINATNAQNVGTANISFYTNGNVGIGTGSTAPSVRFGVTGDTLLRGSGATSATTALTVQNSSSTNLLTVRNDGLVSVSGDISSAGKIGYTNNSRTITLGDVNSGLSYAGFGGHRFTAFNGSVYSEMLTIVGNQANLRIGINQTSPNASALLDLTSTDKGFLPPRMTTTQKNAISSPAAGLVVYDTTLNKLCVYTTAWETITSI